MEGTKYKVTTVCSSQRRCPTWCTTANKDVPVGDSQGVRRECQSTLEGSGAAKEGFESWISVDCGLVEVAHCLPDVLSATGQWIRIRAASLVLSSYSKGP